MTAMRGCRVGALISWEWDSSATSHSSAVLTALSLTIGYHSFPAGIAFCPELLIIELRIETTVVFPLVPVTAIQRSPFSLNASSGSLISSREHFSALL